MDLERCESFSNAAGSCSRWYTYAYAAVSPEDGALDTLILSCVNGSCMEIFLQEVSERHSQENILMVLDGAGWHKNQAVPLPDNLQLLFLPPYSPELNPVEHLWDDCHRFILLYDNGDYYGTL